MAFGHHILDPMLDVIFLCEEKTILLKIRGGLGLPSSSFSGWIDGTGLGVYRRVVEEADEVSAGGGRGCEWLLRRGLGDGRGGAYSLCLQGTVWYLIDMTLTSVDCIPCKN